MKRLFFSVALLALVTLGMTSCKKDYTCDCKDGSNQQFDTQTYPNTSLTDAKRSCDARESFWRNNAQPSANCTIL
jgi:hypothetical protein